MTHEHEQPAAGHLTFPGGGVVSNEPFLEPGPAPFTVPREALSHSLPEGVTVQMHPASPEAVRAAVGQLAHGTRGGTAVAFQMPRSVETVMPSGHTIVFSAPETLTRGDRNELLRYNRDLGDDPDRGMKVSARLLAKLIVSWTYGWPIPAQDVESLDLLPIRDTQEVEKYMKAADDVLFPLEPSPDQHADPTSPTEPSGE